MSHRGDHRLRRKDFVESAAWLLGAASLGQFTTACSNQTRLIKDPGWGDPSSLVTAIAASTVAVPSVWDLVPDYLKWFGYVEHWRGTIPAAVANFWDAPALAGQRAAVIGPAHSNRGLFRFIEIGAAFQRIPLHTTLGWVALEIRARDVDALVRDVQGGPFTHVGGPRDLKFGDLPATLRAAQFRGTMGEPLIFTEDLKYDRSELLGDGNAGPLFIQTLAARPYTATRDFYLEMLKMKLSLEVDYRMRNVSWALGLSEDKTRKMSAVRSTDYCSIEVDEYPDEATERPTASGSLPPGVCMCTLATQGIDAVASALRRADIPFKTLDANPIPPYEGGRAIICRGRSGERVEFVETSEA